MLRGTHMVHRTGTAGPLYRDGSDGLTVGLTHRGPQQFQYLSTAMWELTGIDTMYRYR